MTGIYKITNKINGKCYIGQSVDIKRRWSEHRSSVEDITLDSKLIRAMRKYGLENFTFEVLEECELDLLNEREEYYVEFYNSYFHGYNSTFGGDGSSGFPVAILHEQLLEIYDLLANSNLTQRQIALKYGVGEDMISHINNGHNRKLPGYEYPIRNNFPKTTITVDGKEVQVNPNQVCPICGGIKDYTAKMCWTCYSKQERTVERPLPEQLAKEILELGFSAVGRKYGVSDNAIRKWCKAYNMPVKKNEISLWLLNNNVE